MQVTFPASMLEGQTCTLDVGIYPTFFRAGLQVIFIIQFFTSIKMASEEDLILISLAVALDGKAVEV